MSGPIRRVGVLIERRSDFPWSAGDPADIDAELASEADEDELLSGLQDAGFEVVRLGDLRSLLAQRDDLRDRVDVVFNRAVGYRGREEKHLGAAVLAALGVEYVGSPAEVLSLTRNKWHFKAVARAAGLACPAGVIVPPSTSADLEDLTYPVIVKLALESCSIGLDTGSVVESAPAARAQVARLHAAYAQPVLVESFIQGYEVEVPLVGYPTPQSWGPVVICTNGKPVSGSDFLTSSIIYADDFSYLPAQQFVDTTALEAAATRAAECFGIRDYGRFDFRVTDDGTPWLIEASTHPYLQRDSSFHTAGALRGLTYPAVLRAIVECAAPRLSR